MRAKLAFIIILTALTVVSCNLLPEPTPTPLPGWRSLVSDLLLEDDAFPEGWARIRTMPIASLTDPTINHVYRSWWGQSQGVGKVQQAIWRGYTISDAKEHYAELRQNQFYLVSTPPPTDFYVPFEPPDEITFRSQVADEFYLACGWRGKAFCRVIARYRNYVAEMESELETAVPGHVVHGLTYAEIETAVRAMDARFEELLDSFAVSILLPDDCYSVPLST